LRLTGLFDKATLRMNSEFEAKTLLVFYHVERQKIGNVVTFS
jgi:hypothetical protein